MISAKAYAAHGASSPNTPEPRRYSVGNLLIAGKWRRGGAATIYKDVDLYTGTQRKEAMDGYDNKSNGHWLRLIASSTLFLSLTMSSTAFSQTQSERSQSMSPQNTSVAQYEERVDYFKPEQGLAAINRNDLRLFIYEWFTHFEHASDVSFYLSHFDDKNMSATFPGAAPLTSHADFARWYANLLAQTLWNFHDISAIQIKQTAPQQYLISFIVDWYGEVKPDSNQLAGWQSRPDSHLYHHRLRQIWTVKAGARLVIEKLVVTGGETPSPISE